MDDYSEGTDKHSAAQSALNNRIEAYALLGKFRPHEGSAEAIAVSKVHAALALVDAHIDTSRLLSKITWELNAANMFAIAGALGNDQPLKHLKRQGGLHTEVTLGVRCQQLKLDIKPGDDIVVSSADGEQSITLLVIDAGQDQWLCLRAGLDGGPDNVEADSMRIQATFGEDIGTLEVTKVFP